MGKFGYGMQYQIAGQVNGYTIFNGQTGNAEGPVFNWVAAFKATGNGVAGITAGANASTGTKYQATFAHH